MRIVTDSPTPDEPRALGVRAFYAAAKVIQSIPATVHKQTAARLAQLEPYVGAADQEVDALDRLSRALLDDAKRAKREKASGDAPPTDTLEKSPVEELRHTLDGSSFVDVLLYEMQLIQSFARSAQRVTRALREPDIHLSPTTAKEASITSFFQQKNASEVITADLSLNGRQVHEFMVAALAAPQFVNAAVRIAERVAEGADEYYKTIVRRHTVEGVAVHGSPIATDLALSVYANVDAHGEIEDGKRASEVSTYSIHKAKLIASALREGILGGIIEKPGRFIDDLIEHLEGIWKTAAELHETFEPYAQSFRRIEGYATPRFSTRKDFEAQIQLLRSLDPRHVKHKDKTGLQTAGERRALAFKNETIKVLVGMLAEHASPDAIVRYILERKAELRRFYLEENSFYVCRISGGNQHLGEAPGTLKVEPGTRPVADFDTIQGSGFAEVRTFMDQIAASSRWHDLFVATSPSGTADKSNVLMIGPPGCGKTQALRAVGGLRNSIAIFAQGSDFMTTWKGEAEKNPKRLFEAALKMQRESGRHVHILIDEIDTILTDASGHDAFGSTNLTTEFQILMDGVIHYPHLSVWGATNHPERIPMAMIRRFSKTLVVGELDQATRVKLFKSFVGFLPHEGFEEKHWEDAARRTEGAVGDVIRKMVDHVWRMFVTRFTEEHEAEAEALIAWLNADETAFDIHTFSAEKRAELHRRMRPLAAVHPEDLERAITLHLENVAVYAEIQTSKASYQRHHRFLAAVQQKAEPTGDAKSDAAPASTPTAAEAKPEAAPKTPSKATIVLEGLGG